MSEASFILPAGAGVTFPVVDGKRRTTPVGRAVLADAARAVDPELGRRIEATANWRSGYMGAVRDLTAASARSADTALGIARAGLDSARERLVFDREGREVPLAATGAVAPAIGLGTETVAGEAPAVTELRLPFGGRELAGDELVARLDGWVAAKAIEPSAAQALRRVIEHPEWLALPGRCVVVVGAASEMGPLEPLSAWGAHVLAVDLPAPAIAERLEATAGRGAGRVHLPVLPDGARGADLVRMVPEVAAWIDARAGGEALVLGMYAYADGGAHVRLTGAFDALATALLERRPGTALAYVATPTDAFVVPPAVVADARAAWEARGLRGTLQAPLRTLSRGRLFAPAYAGEDPVADILVEQQGPNYALAKRLQRWRGVVAAADGHPVSFNVGPPAWTRSVTRNRMLAAAYAGARHFGIEIFPPDTSRVLMAALLVHDLHAGAPAHGHPEALFSDQAAHGGLWRAAYEPRSVLGLAALAGLPRTLLGRGH